MGTYVYRTTTRVVEHAQLGKVAIGVFAERFNWDTSKVSKVTLNRSRSAAHALAKKHGVVQYMALGEPNSNEKTLIVPMSDVGLAYDCDRGVGTI